MRDLLKIIKLYSLLLLDYCVIITRPLSVAYYSRSNPIDPYFNQDKHYIKKESPISFEGIKKTLAHSIN